MAPPKPTSPPNPAFASASAAAPASDKKKVTPIQVAFLVERYLADNGFAAALAAFRSDAAHLFAKTNSKMATPKGLLPLADILHDYISLKETRLAVDSAMQGMSSLVSAYYGSASSTALVAAQAQPSSPPLVPPFFVCPTASYSPPHPYVSMPPPHTGTSFLLCSMHPTCSTLCILLCFCFAGMHSNLFDYFIHCTSIRFALSRRIFSRFQLLMPDCICRLELTLPFHLQA
jgi:hypothetical protein